jgi:formylglycine-generating enzyme required for sulfatase activity
MNSDPPLAAHIWGKQPVQRFGQHLRSRPICFETQTRFDSSAMGRFSILRGLPLTFGLTLLGAGAASVSRPAPHVIADLKLEMLWVEPGTFTMGSANDEPERNKAEGPQTRVTLSRGFWLGKTEVTQAQYEAVTGTNPSTFKSAGPDAPVERVSWIDAMAFCEKLNARERAAGRLPPGYAYTLPTEAQWEYAYRAGTTGIYPVEPNASAWFANNSGETTHPVGTKQANAWGFYDMAGNVLEWCFDWYGDYPGGAVNDWSGPAHGYYRMARGGSWRTDAKQGRAAARGGGSAGRLDYTLGFRLALSATPSP